VPEPTVLFDLGNVLVRLDLARGLEHFRRLAGDQAPASLELAKVFFSEASLACNRGERSPERFLQSLARQLGGPKVPLARLTEAWCDIFDRWPQMEALADEVLLRGHPTYLASNTDPIHYTYLSLRLPILRRLTGVHLSYEAGVIKPDPRFFRLLLDRFGLLASNCVYLDDSPAHVESARSLGIRGHVHTGDVEAARSFLEQNGAL